ncbi:MAG: 5-oxoprolinase subunit PxpB [Acidobacteria bacterium]|nr:5-oxoprolinase subunit PxpB [Acidobacteriota bacterium]
MWIRELGDSALLLHLEPQPGADRFDPVVNARVVGIAGALRRDRIAGVRDVVSTFRSVAVFFDPLAADVEAVAAALERHANGPSQGEPPGTYVELPVVYGGDAGPDLAEVAAFARCTPDVVVARHAARTYRVFMLGFLPGFPYMAAVDDSIAAPRRATPRLRVPAGSVGIAGRQTGVYSRESPGGWQIIGRTTQQLFDPDRDRPALLAPGDQVRFVPTRAQPSGVPGFNGTAARPEGVRLKADTAGDRRTCFITVLHPGLLTTIQDSGRWGHQHLGVPVSGPMDWLAHRRANALVGNTPDAATLEATMVGPELRFESRARIAITGADFQPTVDGGAVPMHAVVECRMGSVLRWGRRRLGARAYVAFDGGIIVAPVLGSRSTDVLSGLGGIEGRALRAGDRMAIGAPGADGVAGAAVQAGEAGHDSHAGVGVRLRIMPGPQLDMLGAQVLDALQRGRFTVSPQSDRMGYRLAGEKPVLSGATGEMISDATVMGGLQVPPSGHPILLMADRQTTGGYPQAAVVITADLPLAAQLAPGDCVEFALCSRAEAIAALRTQEGRFVARR